MIDRNAQMELYHKEQDKIFEQYLDDVYFTNWRKRYDGTLDKNKRTNISSIELILFPHCNYNCTYCYITNHGKELYPEIPGESPELILSNLKKVLNWITDNNFKLETLDLFSAEFFAQNQWSDVLDIIYEHLTSTYKFINYMTIPTNMSFVMDDNKAKLVDSYIMKFGKFGVGIFLSASVDGLHCDNVSRPGSTKYNEEFYTRVFSFCQKYNFGFHPMMSATTVHAWKDNYTWFLDKYEEYGIQTSHRYTDKDHPNNRSRIGTPFILEVRNNDWTEERIDVYEEFLRFEFKTLLERVFKNDLEWMSVCLLKIRNPEINNNIQNTMLSILPEGRITCSIQAQLFIRVRYLDIVPCHRTCYDKFQYGSFKLDDSGKICGYKANNIPLQMKIMEMNPLYSMPKCSHCKYQFICMNQCLGSMYESNGDLFTPCESVCNLLDRKYKTLISLYKEYDVFNMARKALKNCDQYKSLNEVNLREEIICRLIRK